MEKIAQAAVEEGGAVLEVGPGLGVLTSALAERAARVAAVELDGGMVRVLGETLAEYGNIQVLHQDILKTDLAAVGREIFGGKPFCVVGNLPYYITSKCLLHVMESGAPVERFTAMVQKEVADRLAAREGEGIRRSQRLAGLLWPDGKAVWREPGDASCPSRMWIRR